MDSIEENQKKDQKSKANESIEKKIYKRKVFFVEDISRLKN